MNDTKPEAELGGEPPLKGEASVPLRGDQAVDADPPAASSRKLLLLRVVGGICVVLLLLCTWVAIVASSYIKMAKCMHIEVERINVTSLSQQQIFAYVELQTHVPSRFGLDLGALDAALAVRSAGSHGGPPSAYEPAATVKLPAFSVRTGDHPLRLIVALDLLGPDALGRYVNASTNAQHGLELQVRVRGSVQTRALFGIPIKIPFDQTHTMHSAPPPSKSHKPPPPSPSPPPPSPEAEAAAREKSEKHAADTRAKRLRECGSEQMLTLPFALEDVKHQFQILSASADRVHVSGIFDALVTSPGHVVIVPNLSAELCVLDSDGTLRSIAQISTRAGTYLQPARYGTSDAIADIVMSSAVTPKPIAWNVTSRILADDMPRFYVRGSTDAEVAAGASPKDTPLGYNTANSAAALQRVLQSVSYPVPASFLETHPSIRKLARFAACSWQQLNKDAKLPWSAGLACASELSSSSMAEIVPKLVDGISDLSEITHGLPAMPFLPGMGDGGGLPSLPSGTDDISSWMPGLPWSQPGTQSAGTMAPSTQHTVSTSGRARSAPVAPASSFPAPETSGLKTRDRGASMLDSLSQLKFR